MQVTLCWIVLVCLSSVSSECKNCTKSPGCNNACCQDGCLLQNVICRDVAENDFCDTPEFCTSEGKCPQDRRKLEDGRVQWDFIGNSCQFRIWVPECNGEGHNKRVNWMKISPQEIAEVGLGARKKLNFIGKKWRKWQNDKEYNVSRFSVAPASYYSLSSNLTNEDDDDFKNQLEFATFWFDQDSNYTFGGNTYAIRANSLKINIIFPTPWPFAKPDNTLTLSFKIQTPGNELDFVTADDGSFIAKLPGDQGEVSFPTKNAAYIDDKEYKDINITTRGEGSNAEISISLPYFKVSLRIDPDAYLNANANTNGQEKMAPIVVLLKPS